MEETFFFSRFASARSLLVPRRPPTVVGDPRPGKSPGSLACAIYQDSYHWNEIIYCIKTAETPWPSRERETGVALGVLELADKRAVRSLVAFPSPSLSFLLVRFSRPLLRHPSPHRYRSLSSLPRMFRASMNALTDVSLLPRSSSASSRLASSPLPPALSLARASDVL